MSNTNTMRGDFFYAGTMMQWVSLRCFGQVSGQVSGHDFRRAILALVCCHLLVACGPEVSGAPKPPPEFGARAYALMGCPSVAGLYAWPPVAGEYANGIASNRQPWDDGRPVPVARGKLQIKVEQTDARVTISSRDFDPSNATNARAPDWAYVEYEMSQITCQAGMWAFEEVEYHDAANYGGHGAQRGFTLARMKDGSLAVGIKTISTGRTAAIFTWGEQSAGQYNAPDHVYWSWSKLQPLR